MSKSVAIAIAAHPDDIEFYMAGTLLLLEQAGWEIHYLNLASGNCGSAKWNAAKTRAVRRREAQQAAKILDAQWHPILTDDLEIFYELKLLRRLAAIIREVRPIVVLTHSPQDYMEDHMNACRLAVTASFARSMPNFQTIPARHPIDNDLTVYHAMPHGLCDGLRRGVIPEIFVNTTAVHVIKRTALALHRSQKEWLDISQGLDSWLKAMDGMSARLGKMSKGFHYAEGWRRHSHLGFCAENADPLRDALGKNYRRNPGYTP